MQLDLSPAEHALILANRAKAAEQNERGRLQKEQRARWAIEAEQKRILRHAKAKELREGGMGCNCDLDNWEPESSTGHSHVCRIHKAVLAAVS